MSKKRKELIEKITEMYANHDFPADINKEVRKWLVLELEPTEREEALWKLWNGIVPSSEANEEALKEIKEMLGMETRRRRMIRTRFIVRAAAVVVPLVFLSALTFFLYPSFWGSTVEEPEIAQTVIRTEEELKKYALLTDGTELWLNTGSELTYTTERAVQLEGEAYFEVARQGGERFTIETDHLKVTVTGTSFNVNSYAHSDRVIVSLYEGGLLVENTDTLIALAAGHELVYHTVRSDFQVYAITRTKPDWLRDIVDFEDTRIGDILEAVEKIYGYRIDYGDFDQTDTKITFRFEGAYAGLEEVLFFMSSLSGNFTYTIEGDTVFLSKAAI